MNKTGDIFIALLRSAIAGTNEAVDLNDVDFEALYSLAKFHDLAHIVYYEIDRRGWPKEKEGELFEQFKSQYDLAFFRHVKRELTTEQLQGILEGSQIPFVLLKGSYLKNLYPKDWMRTSADIDVLVDEKSLKEVEKLLLDAGMTRVHEGQYDVTFASKFNYHIELHFTLEEDFTSAKHGKIMQRVWDHLKPGPADVSELVMEDEMFYFYHIAHMAKHFRNGGNGVRTIIDTWLLNHKVSFDQMKRDALLKEGGLQTFDASARALSEEWFSGKEKDDSLNEFEDYIISGGVFGTPERNIAVRKRKTGSKMSYFFKRVFLPFDSIKHSFPVLKKRPFCFRRAGSFDGLSC